MMYKIKKIMAEMGRLWFLFFFAALFLMGLGLSIILLGCCPKISRPNVTEYPLNECIETPKGAKVCPGPNPVTTEMLREIDSKITDVELCVADFSWNHKDALHRAKFSIPDRDCYTIILAPDWRVSCEDLDQQVFGKAPKEACLMKGFEEKEDCPCGWRGAVQDGNKVVTTPNLYMFKATMVELLTGYPAADIWKTPKLIECSGF